MVSRQFFLALLFAVFVVVAILFTRELSFSKAAVDVVAIVQSVQTQPRSRLLRLELESERGSHRTAVVSAPFWTSHKVGATVSIKILPDTGKAKLNSVLALYKLTLSVVVGVFLLLAVVATALRIGGSKNK